MVELGGHAKRPYPGEEGEGEVPGRERPPPRERGTRRHVRPPGDDKRDV